MSKISYKEYFEALEKIRDFHAQLRKDALNAKTIAKNLEAERSDKYMIDFIRKFSTKRVLNEITTFLEAEITYRKIPFVSSEKITIAFFVNRYSRRELKKIYNIGANSLHSIENTLKNAGYTLLP